MTRRFQFSLRTLFRWMTYTALVLGAVVSVMRLASYEPSDFDPAVSLLWLVLAVTAAGAGVGAIWDESMTRGLLVGAGSGLALVAMLVLSCNQRL